MKTILFAVALAVSCLFASDAKAQYFQYQPPTYGGYPVQPNPYRHNANYGNQGGYPTFYQDNYGNQMTSFGGSSFRYYHYQPATPRRNPFAFPTIGW